VGRGKNIFWLSEMGAVSQQLLLTEETPEALVRLASGVTYLCWTVKVRIQ
jgi:hypothetical protein